MKLKQSLPFLFLTAGIALTPASSQAQLLGLTADVPYIDFGAAGVIGFDVTNNTVTISGEPGALFSAAPFLSTDILGDTADDTRYVEIKFQVDSNGTVVPNDTTVADMTVFGSVDTNGDGNPEFSGILLTAEVTQFGFSDGGTGGNDAFDLRLNNVGGPLAYLYTGSDLAITVTSENSPEFTTPFSGSFSANWLAQAKGTIGSTLPTSGSTGGCHMKLVAKCSVDGGPYHDKCRLKVTRSAKHWERCEYTHNGQTFQKSQYGMHGNPVPNWASNYPETSITFQYTVTNDGENPISSILLEDSFDEQLTGYPSLLETGSSFMVTRTVGLSEGIENVVNLMGTYSGATCGDTDIVVVKDKLRDRKKHDDDDFRDKGKRND